jgi:hypothetical protein
MRPKKPGKSLIILPFFAWNKTDSVQLSTVNAAKTPEAR